MDSGGADRISALPDDLLRCILTRARFIRTAVRTGALSRRWRRVWTQLRDLSFVDRADRPPFSPATLDAICAALLRDAGDLDRVDIDVAYGDKSRPYPAGRLAPLLGLASRRLAGGELRVQISPETSDNDLFDLIQQDLPLPVCERATALRVHVAHYNLKPSVVPASGTFAARRVLSVACYAFGRLDVARLVSAQCPRLEELTLAGLRGSGGLRDLAIRSRQLERIELHDVLDGRFTVEAPRLVRLLVSDCQYKDLDDDHILRDDDRYRFKNVAPKLADAIRTHSSRYCTCR